MKGIPHHSIQARGPPGWILSQHASPATSGLYVPQPYPTSQSWSPSTCAAGAAPVQLRRRDAATNEVECDEVCYDQVDALLLADLAARKAAGNSSPTSSMDTAPPASQAAAGASTGSLASSSWDDILGDLNRANSISANSSSASSIASSDGGAVLADLEQAAVDPWAWVQKFKHLGAADGVEQMQVLKHLGGQAGLVRPRGASFLHGKTAAGAGAGGTAAPGAGSSKKAKRRAAKANAKK